MTHESNQMLITYIIHVKSLVATRLSNNILVKKYTKDCLKNLSRGEALHVFAFNIERGRYIGIPRQDR